MATPTEFDGGIAECYSLYDDITTRVQHEVYLYQIRWSREPSCSWNLHNLSAIALTETWQQWHTNWTCRGSRPEWGAVVVINKSIRLEATAVTRMTKSNLQVFFLCAIYRPPPSSTSHVNAFFDNSTEVITLWQIIARFSADSNHFLQGLSL